MRRKSNAVFVLVPKEGPSRIVGYFTLCALAIDHGGDTRGRAEAGAPLPAGQRHPVMGSSMVVVDAIDEPAARFYQAHGFVRLPESMRLILPMRSIGGGIEAEPPA